MEFLLNLNVKPLLHKCQPLRTNVKTPIDDFPATVLVGTRNLSFGSTALL